MRIIPYSCQKGPIRHCYSEFVQFIVEIFDLFNELISYIGDVLAYSETVEHDTLSLSLHIYMKNGACLALHHSESTKTTTSYIRGETFGSKDKLYSYLRRKYKNHS